MEDLGVGGRITLNLILKKEDDEMWTGYFWIRMPTSSLSF